MRFLIHFIFIGFAKPVMHNRHFQCPGCSMCRKYGMYFTLGLLTTLSWSMLIFS